jgi:hypothetical protein
MLQASGQAVDFKVGRHFVEGQQQLHITPAGFRCGFGRIGWHTFRHAFRTLLDEIGAPMKVQ